MKIGKIAQHLSMALGVLLAANAGPAHASFITTPDIVSITTNFAGSGNGTLDFLFFTNSAGGSTNSAGSFNGDDSNTQLPTGGTSTVAETFITSIGELRSFYITNFPNGSGGSTVNHLAVFLDVSQSGGAGSTLSLDRLDIIIDYDAGYGDARDTPFASNISMALQNATDQTFTGGTKIRELDGAKTIVETNPGGGHADAVIYTKINPFDLAFSDSTRIMFNVSMSGLSNGSEAIFLHGTDAPQDVPGFVVLPEPSGLALVGLGGVALAMIARRRAA